MQNAKDKIDEAALKAKLAAEKAGAALKNGAKKVADKVDSAGKAIGKKLGA